MLGCLGIAVGESIGRPLCVRRAFAAEQLYDRYYRAVSVRIYHDFSDQKHLYFCCKQLAYKPRVVLSISNTPLNRVIPLPRDDATAEMETGLDTSHTVLCLYQIKESMNESETLSENFQNDLISMREDVERRASERHRHAKRQQVWLSTSFILLYLLFPIPKRRHHSKLKYTV